MKLVTIFRATKNTIHLNIQSPEVKIIVHDNFEVTLRVDGIVHVHFKANTCITVELQDELEAIYNRITSQKRPFIFTGDEFVSITAKARGNAIVMAHRIPCSASAIVVNNLAQKIVADYYYKFNRPPEPYKVFKKMEEGLLWVQKNFDIPECT